MERKRIHIFAMVIGIIMLMPVSLFAQSRGDNGDKIIGGTISAPDKNTYTTRIVVKKEDITQRKPELYHSVIKKNGWYVGIGKITEAEAKSMSYYYRFSNMNKAGNWTLVEALKNGGYTSNHNLQSYPIPEDKDDDIASFKEKVQSICKWDFAYDDKGKTVTVERAYDAEDNLILCYTPVRDGSTITGTYLDEWGQPIKLHKEKSILVCSMFDDNGMETVRYITDSEGHILRNENGVEITAYTYDNKHRLIREQYGNATQNYMQDKDGSFGYEYTYDAKDRILTKRQVSNYATPYLYKYAYESGNVSSISLFDIDNKPYNTDMGLHRTEFKYDSKGNLIKKSYYNTEDKLVNIEDKDAGESCLITYNTTKEGYNNRETFRMIKDTLKLNFYRHEDKDSVVYYYNGPTYFYTQVRQKSANGKIWSNEYYRNGNPWIHSKRPYYKEIYKLTPLPGKRTLYTNQYFDPKDRIIGSNGVSQKIMVVDTIKHTKFWKTYNDYNEVYDCYTEYYPTPFDNKEYTRYNRNILGNQAYTFDGNTEYSYTRKNNIFGMLDSYEFYNAWGERAYSTSYSRARSAIKRLEGKNWYYDEDLNPVETDSLFQVLPKAVVIEVTDSIAYGMNIHDGDIVLRYANWTAPKDSTDMDILDLYQETVLTTTKPKDMLLLHSDAESKRTEVREVSLPAGTIDKLGIHMHPLCLNRNEQERKRVALNRYLAEKGLSSLSDLKEDEGDSVQSFMRMQMIIPGSPSYQETRYSNTKVNSPTFVIYADMYDTEEFEKTGKRIGRNWNMDMLDYQGDYAFSDLNKDASDKHKTTLFVMDDRMQVDSIVYMGDNMPFFHTVVYVPEDVYNESLNKIKEWYANTKHVFAQFPEGEEPHAVIYGTVVEDKDMALYKKGCRGKYYFAKLNDWNCTMDSEDGYTAMINSRDIPKSVVLIQEPDDRMDGDTLSYKVEFLDLKEGPMGINWGKYLISENDFRIKIQDPYLEETYRHYLNTDSIIGKWSCHQTNEEEGCAAVMDVSFDFKNISDVYFSLTITISVRNGKKLLTDSFSASQKGTWKLVDEQNIKTTFDKNISFTERKEIQEYMSANGITSEAYDKFLSIIDSFKNSDNWINEFQKLLILNYDNTFEWSSLKFTKETSKKAKNKRVRSKKQK